MPARNMKSALGNSLKAEQEAVRSRFDRAETVLARNDVSSLTTAPPEPQEKPSDIPGDETRVKRDSFTMPTSDYEQIAQLQKRCLKSELSVSKSEILRAGLLALSTLSDEDLVALVAGLPKVKTGRRPLHTV